MRTLIAVFAALVLGVGMHAAPPTRESVERLLTDTGVEKTFETIRQRLDTDMKTAMDQALKGQNASPEAQQLADSFRAKVTGVVAEQMSWGKIKDLYAQVYTESFSQEEIDGLIVFYESPAGTAYVAKQPVVMQRMVDLMKQRLLPLMLEMKQSLEETQKEMQALKIGGTLPELNLLYLSAIPDRTGKPLLLNFWATWDQPSRERIPQLNALNVKYKSKGLVIIAVSHEKQRTLLDFMKGTPMTYYPAFDRGGSLHKQLGVTAIPFAVLVDKAGKIVWAGDPRELSDHQVEAVFN